MKKTKELKKQYKLIGNKELNTSHSKQKIYTALLIIILISFFIYLPILQNGFVNWDETSYIQDNSLIRSFNLKDIFSTYQLGNYHPLTMLVYTIEYHFFSLNETGYHAISLLFHLLNTVLVYFVVFNISKNVPIALFTSLLFGVHPVHVESVAWAAELKDLLYTFFFLASYLCYLKFIKNNKNKYYIYALLLFLLSLLSKAMAVSLPAIMILTDYLLNRKFNIKTLREKIPFFILAITFGIVAILAQNSSDSIQDISIYTFPQRLVFACYSFITYLLKLLLPIQLSAFYPYPIKSGSVVPLHFYTYVFFFIGIIVFTIYSIRFSKIIIFSIGFFSATIFLVLQLLPVGDAIMADRYNYIPSIGIFLLAGYGFDWLLQRKNYSLAIGLLALFTIFFAVQTNARCRVWKDAITLWNDVISKNQNISFAYNNRGGTLMNLNKYEEALKDYNKAISLRPNYPDALNNRGILLMDLNKYEEALADFNKAIQLKPGLAPSYNNRGLVLMYLNRHGESLNDFNKAIELKADYAQGYYNRGLLAMKEQKNGPAYLDYSKAIELLNNYTNAYINRGVILQNEKRYNEALLDYNRALELQPNNSQIYYNKGLVLMIEKRFEEAISSFSKAIELKSDDARTYYNKGMAEYFSGKKESSCKDLQQAVKLGYQPAIEAYNQFCY